MGNSEREGTDPSVPVSLRVELVRLLGSLYTLHIPPQSDTEASGNGAASNGKVSSNGHVNGEGPVKKVTTIFDAFTGKPTVKIVNRGGAITIKKYKKKKS